MARVSPPGPLDEHRRGVAQMPGPGAAGDEPIEIILRVHPVSVTSTQFTYEVEIDRVLLLAQGFSKIGYRLPEVSMP